MEVIKKHADSRISPYLQHKINYLFSLLLSRGSKQKMRDLDQRQRTLLFMTKSICRTSNHLQLLTTPPAPLPHTAQMRHKVHIMNAYTHWVALQERNIELERFTMFLVNGSKALHLSNTILRDGLGEEWSGPCIPGTTRRT